jgi:spermidine/putrescine transport system substrate-binding protein
MAHDRSALDALARATQQRGISRRGFLRGASLSALALSSGPLLAACGTEGARQTAESCVSKDLSATEKQLHFSNWPLYIDQKKVNRNGKKETIYPSLEAFQEESGITVDYVTDVNDNAEFFGIVRNQLAECEPTGRDIFVLTDYMAARMVDLGWIQALDKSKMPNVEANLAPSLKSPPWDPQREHGIPWQSGLTGIAYNAALTKEVRSFDELLSRSDLNGRITLLSEMHDTMLFMLLLTGADPGDFTADQFGQAADRLQQSVDAGQVRAFTGNDYAQDLVKGNVVAAEAWSGDVIQLQFDNPDIKFVVPEEGLSLWSDNMLVPNRATHKANAEKLMNYYYDPAVAAQLASWVNYICPVKGAQDEMTKIDPSLADNPLIFPDDAMLSNAYTMRALSEQEEQDFQAQFAQVTGA